MDVTALIFGVVLLAASGGLFAASLRLDRLVDFLLAAYLLAFTEIVVVSLALSPARWLTRPRLLASLAALLVLAIIVWRLRGKPRPPTGPALRALREALRDPVLAVLAGAVVLALPYLAALALFAPPADFDVQWYHLPRAALWRQEHAVAYVPNGQLRINAFPPVSDIADAFTMILARSDRFAGFVQLGSFLATIVAVFGIARRVGFSPRPAVFGALLFATLPIAVLQAPTALNDVVIASFVAAAVYYRLAGGLVGFVLAELAIALMVGTKATAFYVLPVLAMVYAFTYPPPRRWTTLLVASLAGLTLGSFWYLVNLAESGRLFGELAGGGVNDPNDPALQPLPQRAAAFFLRRVIDAVEPAGAVGRDRWLYGVAAAVVLCIGLVLSLRRRSRSTLATALLASAFTAAALAVHPAYDFLLRAYQKVFFELGRPLLAFLEADRDPARASSYRSWFGPLAVPLVLLSAVLVAQEVRRRNLPRVAIALALAPVPVLLVLALHTGYTPWDGRWVLLAMPLACATWGSVLQLRPLAWAAAAIAATTLVLVLVHVEDRPAGFNVLGGAAPRSVWTTPRSAFMGLYAPLNTVVEQRVPRSSTIGLRLDDGAQEVSYPYFGPRLERRVVFVGKKGEGCDRAEWLVVSPENPLPPCRVCWAEAVAREGWRLYRRVAGVPCPPPSAPIGGRDGQRVN
jgi:hypothetical protein